ncbi:MULTISPECIES: sugar phosphate isomerase/epimerase family protein [Pantoea]|uniref:sugar phosphate isomerase/epimerase family protein n=1 Tax=Pantoea TaxID=53335 RepID=UPI0023F9A9AE|nr:MULTISPECIES: sugar phosphate isomerase/epimerase [Pantoea]MBS6434871.1 sugar phosphate isomerase/epimerase [Pantoea sp.]MDU2728579.1 sugar phosphate isomerase/epimerase [Pantoea sp.]
MKTLKGPGIFLSQFIGQQAPFNSLEGLAQWAASLGYKALQIPCNHPGIFDLPRAASSQTYCDEVRGLLQEKGLCISELSTHLEGQLVAVHPAHDAAFDNFAPASVRGRREARTAWATEQVTLAAAASQNLGLRAHATFSGSLAWPYIYPWPPHNPQLFEEAFAELARRWQPLLDIYDRHGIDLCYELHPGEDLHDGVTFERFLERVDHHPRCNILFDPSHLHLQHIDYLQFIDIYHARIKAFHVKDAEFVPNGRSGVYGGYQRWIDRAGRFRSPGDGQIDFKSIFSRLAQYNYDGWAVLEWECCLKEAETGAREGAEFIRRHIIPVAEHAFDDFAARQSSASVRAALGLPE